MSGDPFQQKNLSPQLLDNKHEGDLGARLHGYLIPFFRYWWVCIPFIAFGTFYNYNTAKSIPVSFVSRGEMMLMGQLSINENNYYREFVSNFFGNETELMRSPVVQERARERVRALYPDLAEEGAYASVQAVHRQNTNFFDLSASGNHPEYTRYFLDSCMEAYLAYRQEMRTSRTDVSLAQVNAEIARLDRDIQELEDQLQDFQANNNLVFIREQANSAAGYLVGLHSEHAQLNTELNLIQLFARNHREKMSATDLQSVESNNPLSVEVLEDPDSPFFKTLQRIRFLSAEHARFSNVLRDTHPKMQYFENEISQLKMMLEVYRQQSAVEIAKREESLKIRIENLSNSIQEWEARAVELSRKLGDFERINSKLERFKQLYNQKLSSIEGVDFARNVAVEPISIAKPATPSQTIRPDVFKAAVRGGLYGLGAGLFCILVLSRWRTTVYTEHDLPQMGDIRSVAYIPRIRGRGNKSRVPLLDPDDNRYTFLEAFRNLRSYILVDYPLNEDKKTQFISITSAIPSEGKSTVSSNVALLLAYSGYKTLLIDADMRQGTQHKSFNLGNDKGLTELLQGNLNLNACIQKTHTPQLDLITRGNAMMNSSELLLTPYCRDMFVALKDRYEYVIVDTPPVMATDDVANLVQFIDSIFVVARISLSTRKTLGAALQMLSARRAKIGGFVLNSCDATSTDYYRYKYYGNYGKAK